MTEVQAIPTLVTGGATYRLTPGGVEVKSKGVPSRWTMIERADLQEFLDWLCENGQRGRKHGGWWGT